MPYLMPQTRHPLTDADLDALEAWVKTLEPNAFASRAMPELAWWRLVDTAAIGDSWQAWLRPGPLLTIHRAMDLAVAGDRAAIKLPELVSWWRKLLHQGLAFFKSLASEAVVVGFGVQTAPSGGPRITDVNFGALPTPTRGAEANGSPPVTYSPSAWLRDVADIDFLVAGAVSALLRNFSYRHLEPTIRALDLPA